MAKRKTSGVVPINRPAIRDETDLAGHSNGRGSGKFAEIGSSGLEAWSGFIREAYHADLQWPKVQPLFSRIRRSDPELTIVRTIVISGSDRRIRLNSGWTLGHCKSAW